MHVIWMDSNKIEGVGLSVQCLQYGIMCGHLFEIAAIALSNQNNVYVYTIRFTEINGENQIFRLVSILVYLFQYSRTSGQPWRVERVFFPLNVPKLRFSKISLPACDYSNVKEMMETEWMYFISDSHLCQFRLEKIENWRQSQSETRCHRDRWGVRKTHCVPGKSTNFQKCGHIQIDDYCLMLSYTSRLHHHHYRFPISFPHNVFIRCVTNRSSVQKRPSIRPKSTLSIQLSFRFCGVAFTFCTIN